MTEKAYIGLDSNAAKNEGAAGSKPVRVVPYSDAEVSARLLA